MMGFVPILTAIIGLLIYLRWARLQEEPMKRFRKLAGLEKPKKRESIWEQLNLAKQKKFPVLATVVGAVLGTMIAGPLLHTSISFGIVIGGVAPYVIQQVLIAMRAKAERKDAKTALELAQAIFAAGGTVEDWIRQCPERLEGPLRGVFELAAGQVQRLGASEALDLIASRTVDDFFQSSVVGIRANYDAASDLQKFISGVMEDIIQQERLERRMKMERQNFSRMQIAILAVPAFLFLVFKDAIQGVLMRVPMSNMVLLVALIAYAVIFWLAYRISAPRLTRGARN